MPPEGGRWILVLGFSSVFSVNTDERLRAMTNATQWTAILIARSMQASKMKENMQPMRSVLLFSKHTGLVELAWSILKGKLIGSWEP